MNKCAKLSAVLVVSGLAFCGCQTGEREEQRIVHTPLELDPSNPPEIVGWWSDGEKLLRVDQSRRYVRYDSLNRFKAGRERGRWTRRSYAHFWIEPDATGPHGMEQIRLRMIDEEIALLVPGRGPFFRINKPPITDEELYFGRWESVAVVLTLNDSLRYSWSIKREDGPSPHFLTGHRGRWETRNGRIVLHPDPAGLESTRMTVQRDDMNRTALRVGDAIFVRERGGESSGGDAEEPEVEPE